MVIQVENLVKRYGDLVALDHFGLQIAEGEIFGLLGPNGSGKTTAINCILSLLKYDKGRVEIFGKPMSPDAYDIKRDIGIVMQNVAVFNELTVQENIDYFCSLYVPDKRKRAPLVEEAVAFTGLGDYRRFLPKKLSGGLLRRLNIACGVAHKPRLIILDEPTVAVDPQSRNAILEGIERLNREGATIVYTSHYMEEVEQLCSRIMIMDKGKAIATGTHSKGMIVDGKVLCYGTANMDIRSFALNFEVNAVIYDEKKAQEMVDIFQKDMEVCRQITRDYYVARRLKIRVKEQVCRLLSPLL